MEKCLPSFEDNNFSSKVTIEILIAIWKYIVLVKKRIREKKNENIDQILLM